MSRYYEYYFNYAVWFKTVINSPAVKNLVFSQIYAYACWVQSKLYMYIGNEIQECISDKSIIATFGHFALNLSNKLSNSLFKDLWIPVMKMKNCDWKSHL